MSDTYARRHLRFGWWTLLIFATLGLGLETLQGFTIGAYLDVSNETRRLMWRLAHAHGTLLAVVHILFGLMLRSSIGFRASEERVVSNALIAASILLPGGFFLGGFGFHGGDPGRRDPHFRDARGRDPHLYQGQLGQCRQPRPGHAPRSVEFQRVRWRLPPAS
jgi:hypothetical protein